MPTIKDFMRKHFRHFNAAVCVDAAQAYVDYLNEGNKMMITLAGAMSTAELGTILAELIRRDKVHIISSTGANLEEDLFNLIAHPHYKRLPNYRSLSAQEEAELRDRGLNRVTDTCIPEEEALRRLEGALKPLWAKAEKERIRKFPYQFMFDLIRSGVLEKHYTIDPKDSWVLAACEKNIPILTPGWEDSTLGNMLVAECRRNRFESHYFMKSGLEQMDFLVDWYLDATKDGKTVGFFQIGGGIAGDFPICVVPLINQDMKQACPSWGYFCQISDSTTSYGSYSGAVPNEKISWGKLDVDTPRFVIESDATIVAPLIFQYVLES